MNDLLNLTPTVWRYSWRSVTNTSTLVSAIFWRLSYPALQKIFTVFPRMYGIREIFYISKKSWRLKTFLMLEWFLLQSSQTLEFGLARRMDRRTQTHWFLMLCICPQSRWIAPLKRTHCLLQLQTQVCVWWWEQEQIQWRQFSIANHRADLYSQLQTCIDTTHLSISDVNNTAVARKCLIEGINISPWF